MSSFENVLYLLELQNAFLPLTLIYFFTLDFPSPPLNAKSTSLFSSLIRLKCSIFVYKVLKSNVDIHLAPFLLLILFSFSITGNEFYYPKTIC